MKSWMMVGLVVLFLVVLCGAAPAQEVRSVLINPPVQQVEQVAPVAPVALLVPIQGVMIERRLFGYRVTPMWYLPAPVVRVRAVKVWTPTVIWQPTIEWR